MVSSFYITMEEKNKLRLKKKRKLECNGSSNDSTTLSSKHIITIEDNFPSRSKQKQGKSTSKHCSAIADVNGIKLSPFSDSEKNSSLNSLEDNHSDAAEKKSKKIQSEIISRSLIETKGYKSLLNGRKKEQKSESNQYKPLPKTCKKCLLMRMHRPLQLDYVGLMQASKTQTAQNIGSDKVEKSRYDKNKVIRTKELSTGKRRNTNTEHNLCPVSSRSISQKSSKNVRDSGNQSECNTKHSVRYNNDEKIDEDLLLENNDLFGFDSDEELSNFVYKKATPTDNNKFNISKKTDTSKAFNHSSIEILPEEEADDKYDALIDSDPSEFDIGDFDFEIDDCILDVSDSKVGQCSMAPIQCDPDNRLKKEQSYRNSTFLQDQKIRSATNANSLTSDTKIESKIQVPIDGLQRAKEYSREYHHHAKSKAGNIVKDQASLMVSSARSNDRESMSNYTTKNASSSKVPNSCFSSGNQQIRKYHPGETSESQNHKKNQNLFANNSSLNSAKIDTAQNRFGSKIASVERIENSRQNHDVILSDDCEEMASPFNHAPELDSAPAVVEKYARRTTNSIMKSNISNENPKSSRNSTSVKNACVPPSTTSLQASSNKMKSKKAGLSSYFITASKSSSSKNKLTSPAKCPVCQWRFPEGWKEFRRTQHASECLSDSVLIDDEDDELFGQLDLNL